MSNAAYYNHQTHTLDWYDGTSVPLEVIDSLCTYDVLGNKVISLGGIFYMQNLRKQRLEDKLKYQNEGKPA